MTIGDSVQSSHVTDTEAKYHKPKRILIKVSGEALGGTSGTGIDPETLNAIAQKIVYLSKYKGIQVAIVVGGGNIFRGVQGATQGVDMAVGDYIGMLATVMNGLALGGAIDANGGKATVMSAFEIPKVCDLFTRPQAIRELEAGHIVVCVSGTGNPFFTTDNACVLRGLELECDYIVKATKVDGVYDDDPQKNNNAKKFTTISLEEAHTKGLRVMDPSAIAQAKEYKIPLFVCKLETIDKIGAEMDHGTFVTVGE